MAAGLSPMRAASRGEGVGIVDGGAAVRMTSSRPAGGAIRCSCIRGQIL